MGAAQPWHWIVLAIVVIALFGYKKLPDASRAIGRSLRIFKTEIKGMTEDDKARAEAKEAERSDRPAALPPADTAPPATPVSEAKAGPAAPAAPANQPVTTPGMPAAAPPAPARETDGTSHSDAT